MTKITRIFLLALLTSLLLACSAKKSTVGGYFELDTDLTIEFIVEADINPDDLDTASPLFLRLYELNATKMMKKADFLDIYEQDKKALGPEMVAVYRLKRFKPGESRSEKFVLKQGVSHVALFAEFNNFQNSKFKLIVPVVQNNVFRNSATIRVTGNQIMLLQ